MVFTTRQLFRLIPMVFITATVALGQSGDSTGQLVNELRQLRLELMEHRLMKHQDRIREIEQDTRKQIELMQSIEKRTAAIPLETAELDERLNDATLDADVRARLQAARADFIVRAPRETEASRTAAREKATYLAQEMEANRNHAATLRESIRLLRQQTNTSAR